MVQPDTLRALQQYVDSLDGIHDNVRVAYIKLTGTPERGITAGQLRELLAALRVETARAPAEAGMN